MNSHKDTGTLYIVATPIGNLDDITQRAIKVLTQVDIIACEDTRHSGRLLANYGIKNKLISFHQHNENETSEKFIKLLKDGNDIALVSDAGTPLISDPGYPLVKSAHINHVKVVPIVGASAIIALLCSCGLPTNEFHFYGFLSTKTTLRQQQLTLIDNNQGTSIIYESTHRIMKCLLDMRTVFGDNRIIAIGREITKTFETIKYGTINDLIEFIESDTNQKKGEFVLAISAKEVISSIEITTKQKQLADLLSMQMPPKKAAKIVAEFLNGNSKQIYSYIVKC